MICNKQQEEKNGDPACFQGSHLSRGKPCISGIECSYTNSEFELILKSRSKPLEMHWMSSQSCREGRTSELLSLILSRSRKSSCCKLEILFPFSPTLPRKEYNCLFQCPNKKHRGQKPLNFSGVKLFRKSCQLTVKLGRHELSKEELARTHSLDPDSLWCIILTQAILQSCSLCWGTFSRKYLHCSSCLYKQDLVFLFLFFLQCTKNITAYLTFGVLPRFLKSLSILNMVL